MILVWMRPVSLVGLPSWIHARSAGGVFQKRCNKGFQKWYLPLTLRR
ncbi:hypothetical protein HMPREF0742_00218 [Rothia aeria F0184]|uniref:Uncharacterized protein n=1 Tax=Rothia aeria F0184 TaxID=888019 RepID=U7V841_9MICC|nr:hypothetical protein HMPREF0742_00218 [Rothia aeria F0184]